MIAIFKKEITLFFSSLIGIISVGIFLLINGLFIWVLPDNTLEFGYASLDQLFNISPFVFLFLIPAITMRSFAEERKNGTIEILSTKPITDLNIVLGKYLAGMVLILFSLLPTFIYYYTIYQLAQPVGNVDSGAIWGSYIGLLFLGATYLSMGLFTSSLTDNQIISFIGGMFLCFLFFQMPEYIIAIPAFTSFSQIISAFSIQSHYISISRGIVDTRDLVFFITFSAFFIFLTKMVLGSRKL